MSLKISKYNLLNEFNNYYLINNQCYQPQTSNTFQKLYQPNDNNQLKHKIIKFVINCADYSCQLDQNDKFNILIKVVKIVLQIVLNVVVQELMIINNVILDIAKQQIFVLLVQIIIILIQFVLMNCLLLYQWLLQIQLQLAFQYGCTKCISPRNICYSCMRGYYLQNKGCVGNYLERQQIQTNDCFGVKRISIVLMDGYHKQVNHQFCLFPCNEFNRCQIFQQIVVKVKQINYKPYMQKSQLNYQALCIKSKIQNSTHNNYNL